MSRSNAKKIMSMINKNVVCIRWGMKYGAHYVNRLYGMVARHLTPPFRFVCFTDSTLGLRDEIEVQPLPDLDIEMPLRTFGIWPKARLWGERLGDLSGPVLFLDLDVVVTGTLDGFFEYGDPDEVILARNPAVTFEALGQTSIFRFRVGKLKPLQDAFRADPQGIADRYRYEQRLVSREAPGGIRFWPRRWVSNFKQHCQRPFPVNYFWEPRLPADCRVVIFPGKVSPHHAIEGVWGDGREVKSRTEYIRWALMPKNERRQPIRHLRHYFIPPKWLTEHWRE